jgi:glycosyltransferase involved in cell wall biosynthesis
MIEASSLFILEAMAMAKPVISSNAGGIPEIIGQDTGILAEPMNNRELANKILQLLHDKQRRAELGNNAYQEVIKKYTWAKIACQTEKEYMRILKEV